MAWQPDYVSLSEAKSFLRIGDTDDDIEIAFAVTAASRAVDRAARRQFGSTDSVEQRTFEVEWDPCERLWSAVGFDDVATTTGFVVTVDGSPLAVTEYELRPRNAAQVGRPWTELLVGSATSPSFGSGPCTVLVDATFGWTAVPDTIKQATLLQASRFFKRRDAPFGVAGSPEVGSEMRLLAKVDPDVKVMIAEYVRDRAVMFA